MYDLKVSVTKVLGKCSAHPPMKPGDYITVHDGAIQIPEGGYICLWALQSLLPVLALKERESAEDRSVDWVWRVRHVQCPDPDGRVVYCITRTGEKEPEAPPFRPAERPRASGPLPSLRVVVDEVRGKCTAGMSPGDHFLLHSGRIYMPAGQPFCLYALQAALPLLPAKQRAHHDGDWMLHDLRVLCPDPAGNVYMRIEPWEDEQP